MKKIFILTLTILTILMAFFFLGNAPESDDILWGITFSQKYASDLDLDWKETYIALLDDLGAKKVRIATYWDLIEPEAGVYDFDDLDWQMEEASKRDAEVILVVGMKTPRWPECHVPGWAEDIDKKEQQERIMTLLEEIILRYKNDPIISYWQIENEPFLDFGVCPWYDKDFFLKEVEKARSLDPDTPILVTESGELSLWFSGARIGDVVGTTMYRQTWWHRAGGFYFKYPIPAVHYHRKALLIRNLFGKNVIVAELQGEPWGPAPTFIIDLEEQEKSMNPDIFRANIDYAKKTGLDEFYFWGVEWWYWMKVHHKQPEIWEEAKKLYK